MPSFQATNTTNFSSNSSCSCGIRRPFQVCHTRHQLCVAKSCCRCEWCGLEPPPATPCQELSRIPPHRSAWSQSRWTRDIFVQDAICFMHKNLARGVCYFALLTPQGTAEKTTPFCSDMAKYIFLISNQTTSLRSTRATPFPHPPHCPGETQDL